MTPWLRIYLYRAGLLLVRPNGTAVATATGAMDPMALHNPASGHSGYIGRSLYRADPYSDDFRTYDTALPPSEVRALAAG